MNMVKQGCKTDTEGVDLVVHKARKLGRSASEGGQDFNGGQDAAKAQHSKQAVRHPVISR